MQLREELWSGECARLVLGLWRPGLGWLHTVGIQRMPGERTFQKRDRKVSGTPAEGGGRPPGAVTAAGASVLLEHLAGHVLMAGTKRTRAHGQQAPWEG